MLRYCTLEVERDTYQMQQHFFTSLSSLFPVCERKLLNLSSFSSPLLLPLLRILPATSDILSSQTHVKRYLCTPLWTEEEDFRSFRSFILVVSKVLLPRRQLMRCHETCRPDSAMATRRDKPDVLCMRAPNLSPTRKLAGDSNVQKIRSAPPPARFAFVAPKKDSLLGLRAR